MREQTGLLDHIADVPAQLGGRDACAILPIHPNAAGGRLDQPVDHLEQRRLAATRRPDQGNKRALLDRQAHIVHGGHGLFAVVTADVLDDDGAHGEVRG